jgi:hypothetical protein
MTNAELGEILRFRLRMTAAYCGLHRPFGKLRASLPATCKRKKTPKINFGAKQYCVAVPATAKQI